MIFKLKWMLRKNVGGSTPRVRSQRRLECPGQSGVVQLQRTSSNIISLRNFQITHTKPHSGSFERQLHSWGICKEQRWTESRVNRNSEGDLGISDRFQYNLNLHSYPRNKKYQSRQAQSFPRHAQLDVTSSNFRFDKQEVRASHDRPICNKLKRPTATFQLEVLGTRDRGHKCPGSRLVPRKQLRQPTVGFNSSYFREGHFRQSHLYNHNPDIQSPTLVSRFGRVKSLRTVGSTESLAFNVLRRTESRTVQKQIMETSSLENIWATSLITEGWSKRATFQYSFCLASSTRRSYNSVLAKCENFCHARGASFPPQDSATLADFICVLSDCSNRPKSIISTATAALSCVYSHLGRLDLTKHHMISRLCSALIKSGTSIPLKHSTVLPIEPFNNMFEAWKENANLTLSDLRLKAITLLAFSLMLRPSDIAPKALFFDNLTGETKKFIFSTDMIEFTLDGLKVCFLGIKNDAQRAGFQVFLPSNPNSKLDPVGTIKEYINRTEPYRSDRGVFLSLNKPYKAISAASVSKILEKSISLVGLAGQGFSAKSFRPTGATRAIDGGIDPEIVRKMGRWKCTEVFREHYVHS